MIVSATTVVNSMAPHLVVEADLRVIHIPAGGEYISAAHIPLRLHRAQDLDAIQRFGNCAPCPTGPFGGQQRAVDGICMDAVIQAADDCRKAI